MRASSRASSDSPSSSRGRRERRSKPSRSRRSPRFVSRLKEDAIPISLDDMDSRIREVFMMFDKDGSGQLDMVELRDVLRTLNPNFSPTEVAYYCKWLDGSGNADGLISHKEFMDWLKTGSKASEDLRRIIIAETGSSVSARLREVFRRFDKDGNGNLDLEEMSRVFRVLSPSFNIKEIKELLHELDTGGDQRVSRPEFMAWIRKGGERAIYVKKAILANTGLRWEQRIRQTFDKYDTDGEGCLDMQELAKALQNLGSLTSEEVRNVCVSLDASGDGNVSFDEFASWIKTGAGNREIEKAKAILAPSDSDGLEAAFYNFCGAGRAELDGTSFQRLCEDCELLGPTLNPAAVDLIFCDTRVRRKGQRTIDVIAFEVALELLAEKKNMSKHDVRMQVVLQGKPVNRSHRAKRSLSPPTCRPQSSSSKTSLASAGKNSSLRGPGGAAKTERIGLSSLWKVFGRHTSAGLAIWKLQRPSSPRIRPWAARAGTPSRLKTPRPKRKARHVVPEEDFSDICVQLGWRWHMLTW
ncbi:CML12 [Symbiodinium natans]|uniref:CML12 protein n=1 Tax=Symbiodinium natans TaxID=878477 RepID=A0A812SKB6_9DINO|nr:CML12 [Symbiodinium natans]